MVGWNETPQRNKRFVVGINEILWVIHAQGKKQHWCRFLSINNPESCYLFPAKNERQERNNIGVVFLLIANLEIEFSVHDQNEGVVISWEMKC